MTDFKVDGTVAGSSPALARIVQNTNAQENNKIDNRIE
jgi:hypothetical protein